MNEVLFSSNRDDWETPLDFFLKLNNEFHFVLDAAATAENAKCAFFFSPEQDGLAQPWEVGGNVFCNPPYCRRAGTIFLERRSCYGRDRRGRKRGGGQWLK